MHLLHSRIDEKAYCAIAAITYIRQRQANMAWNQSASDNPKARAVMNMN
jgi:hypothetical protein